MVKATSKQPKTNKKHLSKNENAKKPKSSSKFDSHSKKPLKSLPKELKKHVSGVSLLKKVIKKKVHKKTPLKTAVQPLVLHTKRSIKKTERALESAEQAKLFKI